MKLHPYWTTFSASKVDHVDYFPWKWAFPIINGNEKTVNSESNQPKSISSAQLISTSPVIVYDSHTKESISRKLWKIKDQLWLKLKYDTIFLPKNFRSLKNFCDPRSQDHVFFHVCLKICILDHEWPKKDHKVTNWPAKKRLILSALLSYTLNYV